jgi:putative membrane protein PagO
VRVSPSEAKTKKPRQLSYKAEFITLSLIVAIAALIGLNYSVMKAALDHTTPLSLAALRTSVGAPFLLAFVLFRKEKFPRKREQWLAIWWISLSITTVSSLFLVIGVSYLSAGVSAMLASTMPLFTALIAIALLKARPGKLGISGVGIGLVGAIVLAVPALGAGNTTLGVCMLLISSISWALGAVLNKKQPAALEISPTMLVAMQIVMSCICLHLVVGFF